MDAYTSRLVALPIKKMTDEQIKELEKHSIMLGQIAGYVSEFCEREDITTLEAVLLMKAEIYELRAVRLRETLDNMWGNRQKQNEQNTIP